MCKYAIYIYTLIYNIYIYISIYLYIHVWVPGISYDKRVLCPTCARIHRQESSRPSRRGVLKAGLSDGAHSAPRLRLSCQPKNGKATTHIIFGTEIRAASTRLRGNRGCCFFDSTCWYKVALIAQTLQMDGLRQASFDTLLESCLDSDD